MKKRILFIVLGVVLLLSACQNGTPPAETTPVPQDTPIPTDQGVAPAPEATVLPVSEELTALLPEQTGYNWIYDGFAEYGHEMTLDTIENDPSVGQTIYSISGQVYDASGGASGKDYSLAITYTVSGDTLSQEIAGEMLMDSTFEQMELLKLPLDENATWEQTIKDSDGKAVNLKCVIEKVSEEDGRRIYAIQYKDVDSDYYERREIQEGVGVLSFEKLYMPETDEPFMVGYRLFTDK